MTVIETAAGTKLRIVAVHGSTHHNIAAIATIADDTSNVATIAIYRDGTAETTWRNLDGEHALRTEAWWLDLCAATAAEVGS